MKTSCNSKCYAANLALSRIAVYTIITVKISAIAASLNATRSFFTRGELVRAAQ